MMLKTRVFELFRGRYKNLSELAGVMGISLAQLYRVRCGTRQINHEFIIAATRAFPGYTLNDLFYVTSADWATGRKDSGLSGARTLDRKNMLTIGQVAGLLGVHRNTVRRWADQEILRAYRFGPRGDRRFWQSDIETFADEKRAGKKS